MLDSLRDLLQTGVSTFPLPQIQHEPCNYVSSLQHLHCLCGECLMQQCCISAALAQTINARVRFGQQNLLPRSSQGDSIWLDGSMGGGASVVHLQAKA